MQSQDSGASAEDDGDADADADKNDDSIRPRRLTKAASEKSPKRFQDGQQILKSSQVSGSIQLAKSDIASGVSDGVTFVSITNGVATGTSLGRGAHYPIPTRPYLGTISSACLGVLPVVQKESLQCLSEEEEPDEKSVEDEKPTVQAVDSTSSIPIRLSVVSVRPATPVSLPEVGCSEKKSSEGNEESLSDTQSSTSSPEWSAILEKIKTLEHSCCCRICQSSNNQELLISPCRCKGSLAYVHLSCLERWLNQSGRTYCELCQFRFNAIQTPRYRLLQSLRLWYCHPRHRRQLLADALIAVILTSVTMGLVFIIILGMSYFILEGAKLGISAHCTQFTITFFLAVVTSGYVVTMYLLVKDQVRPWLHWWRTNVNVRLLLNANSLQGQPGAAHLANQRGHSP